MLNMIFQSGWEPVLTQRIVIGFESILENDLWWYFRVTMWKRRYPHWKPRRMLSAMQNINGHCCSQDFMKLLDIQVCKIKCFSTLAYLNQCSISIWSLSSSFRCTQYQYNWLINRKFFITEKFSNIKLFF